MIQDILTRCDIRIKTLYERYIKIVDERTALIMACCDGGHPELAQPLIDLQTIDNRILMEETHRCLVPMGTPLPEEILSIEEDQPHEAQIKKEDE